MEHDSDALREQLTKVTEAYRTSCPLSEKVELAARCEAAEKQVMSLETEARRALESEAIARLELEEVVKRYEALHKDSSDESTRMRSDLRLKETRLMSKLCSLEEKVRFGNLGLDGHCDGNRNDPVSIFIQMTEVRTLHRSRALKGS